MKPDFPSLSAAALFLVLAAPLSAQAPASAAGLGQPCPSPSQVSCSSGDCSNTPFEPTDCMTTPYGPARANVIVVQSPLPTPALSPNMLLCPGGRPYALCYFSGPPQATGLAGAGSQALPCVVTDAARGIADCSCEVYNSGAYYVDINSILNRGLFNKTRSVCGIDGSRCQNMRDCTASGASQGAFTCPPTVAPVCSFIKNQGGTGDRSTWFYPGKVAGLELPRDAVPDLVSTYSGAMNAIYYSPTTPAGTTPCSGQYAGCMTAPCWYDRSGTDRSIVHCACPLWSGRYQVGQSGQQCPIPSSNGNAYVWSAANTMPSSCASNPWGEQ